MNNAINDKLQALYKEYTNNLPAKINNIVANWEKLNENWQPELLHDFHREIHSLCGSAAIYGYGDLSHAARELETFLKTLDEANATQTPSIVTDITALLDKIVEKAAPQGLEQAPQLPVIHEIIPQVPVTQNKLIYIIDPDPKFAKQVDKGLAEAGYSMRDFNDFSNFKEAIAATEPNGAAMIVDVENVNRGDINFLLKVRKNQQYTMPLICTSTNNNLLTRLKAIRAGSTAFLQKPIEMLQLMRLLDKTNDTTVNESYRILIIDDSPSLGEYYALILQQSGMITNVLTHPMELMETLADFQPDLLLMDIYMPECSGLELAAVLRQEPLYMSLPIIFLSTEDDKLKQLAAMSVGGDDFLTKPILPQHLVGAVRSRAKRAGILSSFMIRDSLTQLLNHNTIVQDLGLELTRAEKQSTALSFVIIDIDHFKSINDTYGHLIGDYVLRKLSELLLSQVEKTDLVGRYGGEEFALILPTSNAAQAKAICEATREKFSKLQFKSGGQEFTVTFSAGIASFPPIHNTEKMIAEADKALYKAKQFGRNQVVHSEEK
ncbi:MAG: diguanylate cyclase [Pseudomonadota bacterium]